MESTSAVSALPGEQRPDTDDWGRVEESTQELIWTRGFKTRRRLRTTRKNRRRRDTHTLGCEHERERAGIREDGHRLSEEADEQRLRLIKEKELARLKGERKKKVQMMEDEIKNQSVRVVA